MNFEFATATRIIFGAGKLAELGDITRGLGRRVLVVSGSRTAAAEQAVVLLRKTNVAETRFVVAAEPTVDLVDQGTKRACEAQCDFVVAIGGGSVIDAGKAIA